jgi:hypothetical protein
MCVGVCQWEGEGEGEEEDEEAENAASTPFQRRQMTATPKSKSREIEVFFCLSLRESRTLPAGQCRAIVGTLLSQASPTALRNFRN